MNITRKKYGAFTSTISHEKQLAQQPQNITNLNKGRHIATYANKPIYDNFILDAL